MISIYIYLLIYYREIKNYISYEYNGKSDKNKKNEYESVTIKIQEENQYK